MESIAGRVVRRRLPRIRTCPTRTPRTTGPPRVACRHGERSELSPRDALRIASDAEPDDPPGGAMPGHDLAPGGRVRVATEDFAPDPVEGELVHATRDTIAIRRDDPEVGRVHVHFPRLGYEVTAA